MISGMTNVQSSIRAMAGMMLAIGAAACASSTTEPEATVQPPMVVDLSATAQVAFDENEYKVTCLAVPEDPVQISTTCPVVRWNGYDYWALSFGDNRSSMAIHAFDASGQLHGVVELVGARYVYAIDIDDVAKTVTFRGQADRTVTMTWDEMEALR